MVKNIQAAAYNGTRTLIDLGQRLRNFCSCLDGAKFDHLPVQHLLRLHQHYPEQFSQDLSETIFESTIKKLASVDAMKTIIWWNLIFLSWLHPIF